MQFPHDRMSDEDWKAVKETPPMRASSAVSERSGRSRGSRPPSAGGSRSSSLGGGSNKGGGKPRGRSKTKKNDVPHCFQHLKGKCTRGDQCGFPHLDKEALAKERKKLRGSSRSNSKGSNKSNKSK